MAMKDNTYVENKLVETDANVCPWTDKSCNNCHYFDPDYHNGYCDYHKVDTSPSKHCSDWWEG